MQQIVRIQPVVFCHGLVQEHQVRLPRWKLAFPRFRHTRVDVTHQPAQDFPSSPTIFFKSNPLLIVADVIAMRFASKRHVLDFDAFACHAS